MQYPSYAKHNKNLAHANTMFNHKKVIGGLNMKIKYLLLMIIVSFTTSVSFADFKLVNNSSIDVDVSNLIQAGDSATCNQSLPVTLKAHGGSISCLGGGGEAIQDTFTLARTSDHWAGLGSVTWDTELASRGPSAGNMCEKGGQSISSILNVNITYPGSSANCTTDSGESYMLFDESQEGINPTVLVELSDPSSEK